MSTSTTLNMIHVKGNHREIGRQIGEACGASIQRMMKTYQAIFDGAHDEVLPTWGEAVLLACKYYPYAREHTPQYIEELAGIAEASGVDLDDLMVLNSMGAITSDRLHLGCTSLAVSPERSENGHVLIGHNVDWLPEDEENTYLLHATPENAPPFLAITTGGLLPSIGFNAAGIAQCCDSVYPSDVRVGVPRLFVSRAVLGTTQLAAAIRTTLMRWRAAGYNHLIADKNGELYNIEVSAHHFATIYGTDGYLAHTNNYLTRRMKQIEACTDDLIGSRVRVNRAQRLLRQVHCHTAETLKMILSDHVNCPDSICSHSEPNAGFLDRQKTIASIIIDLTALEIQVCRGNPCEGTYETYRLEV